MVNFKATALAGGETLELAMYDYIGSDFFGDGVTAKMVSDALARAPNAKLITIRMDSPGGDAFMGWAIANLLRTHSARKEMDVDGMCASIATAIAAECDEVRMGKGAQMMIHEAQGGRRGQAHELRACAVSLENLNQDIAQAYAQRTGKALDEMLKLMAAETWFNAQQAVDMGFAHKVVVPAKQSKPHAHAFACADLKRLGYRNIPTELGEPAQLVLTTDPTRNTSESDEEDSDMNKTRLAIILALAESAPDEAFETAITAAVKDRDTARALLAKLDAAASKSGEEMLGIVLAWKASHESLPDLQTKLAALQLSTDAQDLEAAVAEAKKDNKLTPALEAEFRRQLTAKEATLSSIKSTLKALHPIPALANAGKKASSAVEIDASAKHNGKTFAEMTGSERAALKREDPELYTAMLKASQDS